MNANRLLSNSVEPRAVVKLSLAVTDDDVVTELLKRESDAGEAHAPQHASVADAFARPAQGNTGCPERGFRTGSWRPQQTHLRAVLAGRQGIGSFPAGGGNHGQERDAAQRPGGRP